MNIAQHLTGIELDKLYATAQFYIFPVPFCDFANSLFLAKGDGDMPISVHRRCRASSISLVCCHKKYFIFFRMESSFICCHKKIKNKKNIFIYQNTLLHLTNSVVPCNTFFLFLLLIISYLESS